MSVNKYLNICDYLKNHNISISVITMTCYIGCEIKLKNVAKYIQLSPDGIGSVRFGDPKNPRTNRAVIIPEVKKHQKGLSSIKQHY